MPLTTGQTVSRRYLLEALAGEGATAKVYRAKDERTGKTVALKVFNEPVRSEDEARYLSRELKALGVLDHPNVVRMLDASPSDDDEPWICTEWLDGSDCATLVKELGPLAEESVIGVALGALAGIEAAHELTIVHRDIKPANIFLCKNGRVVVLDFGVARAMSDRAGKTLARAANTSIVGTPAFLSPEQLREEPLTNASDIYALGVSLRFLLTGRLPFKAEQMLDLMKLIVTGAIEPVPDFVSPRVKQVLDAMVSPNVATRPTAKEARRALFAAAEAMPGFQREFERFCRRADETTSARLLRPPSKSPLSETADTERTTVQTLSGVGEAIETPPRDRTQLVTMPQGTQIVTTPGDPERLMSTTARKFKKEKRSLTLAIAAAVFVLAVAVVLLARPRKPSPPPQAPIVATETPPAPVDAPRDALPAPAPIEKPTVIPEVPSEPKEAPRMGTLQLTLRQWANVRIDGKDFGRRQLSARFELPSGKHKVTVSNPAYGERSFEPQVRGGQTAAIEIDFKQ